MRLDQSLATVPNREAAGGRTNRRLMPALAVAALLVVACSSPGAGSPSAAAPSAGGASPSSAASPAGSVALWQPEQPINMVVPFAAGGPTDTVTRLVADPMGATLGQQIVVQNVAGAGGTLAAGQVATAAPDGYTVLMHHIGMSTAPALYPKLSYDPQKDFKPIGLVTNVPMTIIGKKDLPPKTLEELTAYVKANSKKVTLANAGTGAASQLCGLLIEQAMDVDLTEVPYDGTGPALTDLVGGQVDFMCDQTTNTAGQIKAGKVQAYAVTTPERVEAFKDLPTTAEAGLPDVEVGVWHGLYVPKDTPDDVVKKLTDALATALKDQNVVTKMADLGTAPVPADQVTPEAHAKKLTEQIALWGPIIKDAGIKSD